MEKPEKRKLDKDCLYLQYDKGYNHAWNEWEAYHNYILKELEEKEAKK